MRIAWPTLGQKEIPTMDVRMINLSVPSNFETIIVGSAALPNRACLTPLEGEGAGENVPCIGGILGSVSGL